jgi:hypothetical protein
VGREQKNIQKQEKKNKKKKEKLKHNGIRIPASSGNPMGNAID